MFRTCLLTRVLVKVTAGAGALVLASGCSAGPMPVSQSRRDPSSPSAPEGVKPPALALGTNDLTMSSSGDSHDGHAHHGSENGPAIEASADGGTQAAIYVCPMHPEVTSNAPGLCPKCNMKLVPKK